MKEEINCPILSSEKFSKEVLSDMIGSLEQLENIKTTIFNRLNTAFGERVKKLCDIKARINRANQIISSYSSINEAITLKSKYHYPTKNHYYYTPTIINKTATTTIKEQPLKLNKIVLNDKTNLGTKSLGNKDKIITYDKFLSFSTQFKDLVNELENASRQEANLQKSFEEFEPILNHTASDFTFGTKMKIDYVKKQQYNPQLSNREASINLQEFLNEKRKEEEKRRKMIQQAPKSILEKQKLKKYKKKSKKLISQTNSSKVNINLPTNIGLGGVADLTGGDDNEDKIDEKNEEEDEEEDDDFIDDEQVDPQLEKQEDDDVDMPIDYIRINNRAKSDTIKNNANPSNNNNNYQKAVYNNSNSNNNNNNNSNTNQVNTSQIKQSNSEKVPPPSAAPKVVAQPQSAKAPNPPPSVSSNSNVVVVSKPSGAVPPPPPPPPPPPMVPTVPTKVSEEKVEKKSDSPQISLEQELAKAMSGLKKKVNVEVKEKKKELSFAEQLALSRNKLKKAVIPPKPVEKKKAGMDLLSQQIKLRFQNLRMHEEKEEENSDDDSF